MKLTTHLLSLSLLLASHVSSPACWTFAYDPLGLTAVQQFDATIATPFRLSPWANPNIWFDQLGFYDATGAGLPRDVVVGIQNVNGTAQVIIPAGSATEYRDGFRWADLGQPFFLDPTGDNFLYYEGKAGDVVQLVSPFEVHLHPLFELAGNGLQDWGSGPPAFMPLPTGGRYAFGANGGIVPEPSQWALMAVTLLGAGGYAWHRQRTRFAE
jgi:hypothetical protein